MRIKIKMIVPNLRYVWLCLTLLFVVEMLVTNCANICDELSSSNRHLLRKQVFANCA